MSATPPAPAHASTECADLISIVLPVHNGVRYLEQSLESIYAQTHTRWELVLVDDASTDATPELLAAAEARDPARVRVLRHARNRGLPAALNTGFSAARGAYHTWTSDDNAYLPEALATLKARLDAEPRLAGVYADYELIDEAGQRLDVVVRLPDARGLVTGPAGIPCFLWRDAVWRRVGPFAEDLALAEDYEYWLRVLAAGLEVTPLHQTLYLYRRHAASLTDRRRGATFAAAERALLRWKDPLTRRDASLRGAIWLYLSSLATWRGAYRAAVSYTLRAAAVAPRATTAQVITFARKRLTSGATASQR